MLKIFAVVVTYNRKNLLIECLESLQNQSYGLGKIVVVNNNSSDGTHELLASCMDESLVVLNLDENIGGAGGFSLGMKKACEADCDFVLLLDDDCILEGKYVERLINDYEEQSPEADIAAMSGTVYTNGQIVTDHRGYIVHSKMSQYLNRWKEHEVDRYWHRNLRCDIASFCGLMVCRKTIDKIGFPKAEYFIRCDDTEYSLRISSVGTILNVNNAILIHRIQNNKTTSTYDYKTYYDIRNGIVLSREYRLYGNLVKIIVKYGIKVIGSKRKTVMFVDAIKDSITNNLGKNEKYISSK